MLLLLLQANSLFGKLCERKRDRFECTFVQDEKTFARHSIHPRYHRSIMINNTCSVTIKRASSWLANQAIQLAFSVTQTAKWTLLRSFYMQISPTLERFGLSGYCVYTDSTYQVHMCMRVTNIAIKRNANGRRWV